ncbi:MAG: hypothetical protein ACREQP_01535, partial [Candidatus Binatia bacterium]
MVRRAILLGGLVCVVAVVLLVWWGRGGREKDGSPGAGKQETVTSRTESSPAFGQWIKSWILPAEQGSQSAGWEPKDVEEAVRKTFLAYNRKDLPAFKNGWTDRGFQQAYERPKEKITDFGLLSLLSFRPYTIGDFSNTAIDATTASTEVGLTYGEVQEPHRLSLVREGDRWRIDRDEKLPDIAKNTALVAVKFQHFNLHMDRTRLAPGEVAFNISNTDTQQHEFIVKRITESESEETIGMTKPLNPG